MRRFLAITILAACSGSLASAQEPAPGPAPAPVAVNARAFKKRGNVAYQQRNYTQALNQYTRYLNSAANRDMVIDAVIQVLKCHMGLKTPDDGLVALDGVGGRLTRLLAQEKIQAKAANLPEPADSLFDPTPEQELQLLYWRGEMLRMKGDIEGTRGALPLFTRVAAEAADNGLKAQAHLALGHCYIKTDFAKASSNYKKAADLAPSEQIRQIATIGNVQALIKQRRYVEAEAEVSAVWDKAEGIYRALLGMLKVKAGVEAGTVAESFTFFKANVVTLENFMSTKEHFITLRTLGLQLKRLDKYDDSLYIFDKMFPLIRIEEQKQMIMLDHGEVADTARLYDVAIDKYTRFMDLYRTDSRLPRIRFLLGRAYEKKGAINEAVKWYAAVVDDEKAEVQLRFDSSMQLGLVYRGKDARDPADLKQAKVYFERAALFNVDPSDQAKGYYHAAETSYFDLSLFIEAAGLYGKVADNYRESVHAESSRYKQAIATVKAKLFKEAAVVFGKFLEEWPKSERRGEALKERGLALSNAGDYPDAIQSFETFIKEFPESQDAPLTQLHAADAAWKSKSYGDALRFLSRVVSDYSTTKYFPEALYRRADFRFRDGRYAEATQDSLLYIEKFGKSTPENEARAADVYQWLGDHSANERDLETAESYFKQLVERYPESPNAPAALLQAANMLYLQIRKDIDSTELRRQITVYLDWLDRDYVAKTPPPPARIRARALYIRGDLFAYEGRYDAAAEAFRQATELMPGQHLGYSAKGRLGECLFSMISVKNTTNLEDYAEVITCLQEVADAPKTIITPRLEDFSRFRMGLIYTLCNEERKAADEFEQIIEAYTQRLADGKVAPSDYFSHAVFKVADIYIKQERYQGAIRVYNTLASFKNIPTSGDAKARAKALRDKYGD
jgi:tetratricopeptide (TPR) repeat protein